MQCLCFVGAVNRQSPQKTESADCQWEFRGVVNPGSNTTTNVYVGSSLKDLSLAGGSQPTHPIGTSVGFPIMPLLRNFPLGQRLLLLPPIVGNFRPNAEEPRTYRREQQQTAQRKPEP